jgi:UDP-N-acetylmuramate dehydrogenase
MIVPAPLRGRLLRTEPMARHTSWRAGGPADRFYVPADLDDLKDFLAREPRSTPLLWLGLGSNLLVRDGGFRGTVISVAAVLDELRHEPPDAIVVGAGVACAKVARFAAARGLAGCEFLAGIPGTIGGALAMNAGAHGGEIWDVVTAAWTLDRDGGERRRTRAMLDVGYRRVALPEGEWFIRARLALAPDPERRGAERIRELLVRRTATQPTGEFSCGSVFRNPPGDYAGRLVEQCGLKGARRGAARVSERHANFIVNDGGASAADIEALIRHVQECVRAKTGIDLEPEVRIVGEAAS